MLVYLLEVSSKVSEKQVLLGRRVNIIRYCLTKIHQNTLRRLASHSFSPPTSHVLSVNLTYFIHGRLALYKASARPAPLPPSSPRGTDGESEVEVLNEVVMQLPVDTFLTKPYKHKGPNKPLPRPQVIFKARVNTKAKAEITQAGVKAKAEVTSAPLKYVRRSPHLKNREHSVELTALSTPGSSILQASASSLNYVYEPRVRNIFQQSVLSRARERAKTTAPSKSTASATPATLTTNQKASISTASARLIGKSVAGASSSTAGGSSPAVAADERTSDDLFGKWFAVTKGWSPCVTDDINFAAHSAGPEKGLIYLEDTKADAALRFIDAWNSSTLMRYYGGTYYPLGAAYPYAIAPK
ncbi:hypothetical protein NP233_g1838 [Leucocoprinus birnbaumii]|uniref:Uncharacterized protein n=1 Tax=Leucocoprinus birnbaumii TaxID=56174 RepID=A0AAD5YXN8_9AGAR|nr:hypothetical protein NP233_g1838 [Leucocoprinus birnbaumii]